MNLKVKLFADGAEKSGMIEMYNNPLVSGFTTNPTLMRKVGIDDYKSFSLDILSLIKDKPISLEVFSDDFDEMERQAHEIASWGKNVYVKIPITNTKSKSSIPLIKKLSDAKIKVNVTAVMTIRQVENTLPALINSHGSYISVFAGRIADTGIDPVPIMEEVLQLLSNSENVELIWASPRELYNVVQADSIGCHIITATNDILKKLPTLGKDLTQFSLDTVKMFYNDAQASGFHL